MPCVEFIAENGGDPGVRLRKSGTQACQPAKARTGGSQTKGTDDENSQEDRDFLFADRRYHQRSRFTLSVGTCHGPPLRVWRQGYCVFFTICG